MKNFCTSSDISRIITFLRRGFGLRSFIKSLEQLVVALGFWEGLREREGSR